MEATQRKHSIQFEFVQVPNPGKRDPRAAWRKQVRSHAARNPRARQQRVIAHCADQPKQSRSAQDLTGVEGGVEIEGQWTTSGHSYDWGFFYPSPVTPLSAARTDPFQSFARRMGPFENYLLDHFVHYVVSSAVGCLPFTNGETEADVCRDLVTHWVKMAAVDPGMTAGVLMLSCTSLKQMCHPEVYGAQALKYKTEVIRELNLALRAERSNISDLTITKTLTLASDASFSGDNEASFRHFDAAREMVRLRGGPKLYRTKDNFGKLVIWFIAGSLSSHPDKMLEFFCINNKPKKE